jgi:hypothetical protein
MSNWFFSSYNPCTKQIGCECRTCLEKIEALRGLLPPGHGDMRMVKSENNSTQGFNVGSESQYIAARRMQDGTQSLSLQIGEENIEIMIAPQKRKASKTYFNEIYKRNKDW